MARHPLDAYYTPTDLTLALQDYIKLSDKVKIYEPCNGLGAISRVFESNGNRVYTADIDPEVKPDYVADARTDWPLTESVDWVITNPPFNGAMQIRRNIHAQWLVGDGPQHVAMLLRLSFLEPTKDREQFLSNHPPTQLLVLPRTSFTLDGKTDSVTCAWMIWDMGIMTVPDIRVYTKDDLNHLKGAYNDRAK